MSGYNVSVRPSVSVHPSVRMYRRVSHWTASRNYLLIYLLNYLLTYLFTYLLTYLPTYLLTYLLTHLLTYLLTHSLTPWSRVVLQKLTDSQLGKKVPAFYGTQRFITAIKRACHLSLSSARPFQSMPSPSHFLKILPSTPGSSK